VASRLVKHSHHPDGSVLFSQDGRVLSRVRKARTRLSFKFSDLEPGSLKFVGGLHSLQNLARRIPNGIVEPKMNTIDPSGKVGFAFVCSSPAGTPGDDRVLLLSCEATWFRFLATQRSYTER
jgi:hypothetical protein